MVYGAPIERKYFNRKEVCQKQKKNPKFGGQAKKKYMSYKTLDWYCQEFLKIRKHDCFQWIFQEHKNSAKEASTTIYPKAQSHNSGYKYAENIESFIIGWTFSRNFSMVIIPHHSLN